MPIHDLHCTGCAWEEADRTVVAGQYPACPVCGAPTTWTPRLFATDVRGQAQQSTICEDVTWTTPAEYTRKMAARGFVRSPLADPHHGARVGSGEYYKKKRPEVDPSLVNRLGRREGMESRKNLI